MALEDRYGDVKKLTATAVIKSETVSKEALSLFIIGVPLPQVNLTELHNRVESINYEVRFSH